MDFFAVGDSEKPATVITSNHKNHQNCCHQNGNLEFGDFCCISQLTVTTTSISKRPFAMQMCSSFVKPNRKRFEAPKKRLVKQTLEKS